MAQKHAAAIAHIRQLCCLGLGGEVVMPSILKALHDIVGADSNAFFWVGKDCEITNICAEKLLPPDIIKLYFRDFFDYRIGGFRHVFADALSSKEGVTRANIDPRFYNTDYYNLVWREHLNAHHAMYAVVCEHGKPLGLLSMYRAPKDPPFGVDEERRLAAVTHYIAHALSAQSPNTWSRQATEYRDTERKGLVVVNTQGESQWLSAEGRRLMFLATYPRISRQTLSSSAANDLPQEIIKLCDSLHNVFRGHDGPPPATTLENCWGRFVFRAHWLDSNANDAGGLIGVDIEHQEPLALKVLETIRPLQLPPRQQEVLLFLVDGRTNAEIADLMHIGPNGAKFHVGEVLRKLGVHSRDELLLRSWG
jgi:DNA-binding CsgD family transcriptional regulator